MGYKLPQQTAKCMKNGGSVKMQEQMAHASVPHGTFQGPRPKPGINEGKSFLAQKGKKAK